MVLRKRDEGKEVRPPQEEPEFGSFDDPATGLAEMRITRARAIKLAGAALAGGTLSLFWAGEADARNRKRRRRRRRKRRRKAEVAPPQPLAPVLGGVTPLVLQITNPSDKPLTIDDVKVVDGDFLGAGLLGGPVTIAPNTGPVPVTVNLETGNSPVVDAGSIRLIDERGIPITVIEGGVEVGDIDLDVA